jgi:hypothetical protein
VAPAVNAFDVMPIASITATNAVPVRGSKVELRGRASLAPFADRFTATVYERLEGSAGAAWVLRGELAMGVALSVARSFPKPSLGVAPDVQVGGESSVVWSPKKWLSLGGLLRASHVELLIAEVTPMNSWLASVSVTVREQEHVAW